ncbi:MAG TPA: hypothetical protein VN031_03670 [Candidatus Microsaccharimonas sp.]|nr:hypothetical protein [Candidatus Microsaccharimonas sp.]
MPTQRTPELLRNVNIDELTQPRRPGVVRIARFMAGSALRNLQDEIAAFSPEQWHEDRDAVVSMSGQRIERNHRTFAHKLSRGDQAPLTKLPELFSATEKIEDAVRSLGLDSLRDWEADDVTVHHYDRPDRVGIGFHRDSKRFWGIIPILSVEGSSNLAIRTAGAKTYRPSDEGDLLLLRAPGIIDEVGDFRPEHAVTDLSEFGRISLMVRANLQPDTQLPGQHYNNWVI